MSTTDILTAAYTLTALQYGAVALWQLHDASEAAVRHWVDDCGWERPANGVYLAPGGVDSWHRRLMAAVLAAGPGAVASHRSAAALWNLPGFRPGPIEVLRAWDRSGAHPLGRVRRTRSLPAAHVAQVDGIPVTTLARTLVDLAGTEHPLRFSRAGDTALSRGLPPARLWEVHGSLSRRGRRGARVVQEFLERRGEGYVAPASELEQRWRDLCQAAGVPEGSRQVDVGDNDHWVGQIDVTYPELRLLVELDSRLHHTSLTDREADRRRDNELMAAGWRVLRFTWWDLLDRPDWVRKTLQDALGATV